MSQLHVNGKSILTVWVDSIAPPEGLDEGHVRYGGKESRGG